MSGALIDTTEKGILTALRGFLAGVLAPGTPIIRAQVNRVPEPALPDFVLMTPLRRERQATNIDSWEYDPDASSYYLLMKTEITYQLDVHGPASAENAQIIATVLRDGYAVDAFAASGLQIAPLYASEPHEMPFVNAESQVEMRWVLEACLAANITVTIPQQFANTVNVGLISVDTLPDTEPAPV
jgi:hypothetical protein